MTWNLLRRVCGLLTARPTARPLRERPAPALPTSNEMGTQASAAQGWVLVGEGMEAQPSHDDRPTEAERKRAGAWLDAMEAGRLDPPKDVRDAEGWDTYWNNWLEVGSSLLGFSDIMSSDSTLPALLERRGVRTILCTGNGLSLEALSLALLGYHVTALDISVVPAKVLGESLRNPEHPLNGIPGFGVGDDGVVVFAGSGPIDSNLCPAIHRGPDHDGKHGGSLTFVTGDFMDDGACPGPFDAVIERRLVQLFPRRERAKAVDRLVARLGARGLFVSQEHQGGWRPGQSRAHYAEGLLRSRGFVLTHDVQGDACVSAPRAAHLRLSTG